MITENFIAAIKYCLYVRPERVDTAFLDELGTINYQVKDGDFQRFVDSVKKPSGREDDYCRWRRDFRKGGSQSDQDMLMEQLCYAQPAGCAQKLPPVSGTKTATWCWHCHEGYNPYQADTLYLHERHELSALDIEVSRNGLPFAGYLRKHRDDHKSVDDESCVGAVTVKGKLLLRESTPICVPHVALFTAALQGGVLRITRHYTPFCLTKWRESNEVIYAEIDMTSNKQEFERGIRTVNKLRMAVAEFRESVAASVGDPSTYDVAPDDWMPPQESFFSFPEIKLFSKCISSRLDDTMRRSLGRESRIGREEFWTFKCSRWTAGSDSLRIFSKYAFDHQPPLPPTTNIPLTELGLDPADPRYKRYSGCVPSNFYITVCDSDDSREWCPIWGSKERRKLIAKAKNFVHFAENMTQLVDKELLGRDNLAAVVVEVRRHEIDILLISLRDVLRTGVDCTHQTHWLKDNEASFELGFRALALARKTAAEIRGRLCADVAARRTGEIHVPAEPDRMEVSRSEDEEISNVNDTMAGIDLGAEAPSGDSAPVEVVTNATSQRGQKRGRDEEEDDAPQTVKHRRMMPQACLGADAGSVGLAAADTKENCVSQDDRRRRQDEDEGEATGTKLELRTGGAGMSGGPAPVDMKANPASQDGQDGTRDEGETPRTVTTGAVATGTMTETRPGSGRMHGGGSGSMFGGGSGQLMFGGGSGGLFGGFGCSRPVDMKANPASQDGRDRRRDEDDGETPRPVNTGTTIGIRPGGGSMFGGGHSVFGGGSVFGGPAPVDGKANPASTKGLKRGRDEEEDEVPHLAEKYRRPEVDASSRKKVKVEEDHVE